VMKHASQQIAAALGKPEQYMMVSWKGVPHEIRRPAASRPLCGIERIGCQRRRPGVVSALCELIESELGVARRRIYINFADVLPTSGVGTGNVLTSAIRLEHALRLLVTLLRLVRDWRWRRCGAVVRHDA